MLEHYHDSWILQVKTISEDNMQSKKEKIWKAKTKDEAWGRDAVSATSKTPGGNCIPTLGSPSRVHVPTFRFGSDQPWWFLWLYFALGILGFLININSFLSDTCGRRDWLLQLDGTTDISGMQPLDAGTILHKGTPIFPKMPTASPLRNPGREINKEAVANLLRK